MASLVSHVLSKGVLLTGAGWKPEVEQLQLALEQAGYRLQTTGEFDERTELCVRRLQQQHGMKTTGVVDSITASLLDCPGEDIIASAYPNLAAAPIALTKETPEPWLPYDDTASMLSFYQSPWKRDADLLVSVPIPWMKWGEARMHVKAARQMAAALNTIWQACSQMDDAPLIKDVTLVKSYDSLSYVGSSRRSAHAFGAAIQFNSGVFPEQEFVDAFRDQGFIWGAQLDCIQNGWYFQLALD
ncbi:MAG TPA: M15 family metallopeptidase [Candidatus Acidoferrum sp.]|nr:M15 family metallopeptidase [Candidatus Acidoferrum sp.]